jgi:hypothetical protein
VEELLLLIQKTYGLIGLFLVAPIIALVFVWRQNVKLQKDLSEAQKLRVKDAQDINSKLIDIVREQTGLSTETNLALERIGDAMNEVHRLLNTPRR